MHDATQPERWLPIPGFEGSYEVSDFGRVRSLDQTFASSRGNSWSRAGRVLRASVGGSGYPHVSLPDRSRRSGFFTQSVHVLVAATFIGPAPAGMEVRHLDGNRANCRLGNLAYGTPIENEADKKKHGTHEKSRRTHCPLDHRLAPPNLVLGALKRGHRNCMACSRARAAIHRGAATDLKTEADRHYRAIMDQAVGNAATGA